MSAEAKLIPWRGMAAINREFDYHRGATVLTKAELFVSGRAQGVSLLPPSEHPEDFIRVILEAETEQDLLPEKFQKFVDEVVSVADHREASFSDRAADTCVRG